MEWSVAEYLIENPDNLDQANLTDLLDLIALRDIVFLNYREKFNYLHIESSVKNIGLEQTCIELFMVSVQANRSFRLMFGWTKPFGMKSGTFTYLVTLLSGQNEMCSILSVDLLAKKRHGVAIPIIAIKDFSGTFKQRAEQSLIRIKEICDKYADDIISGEAWNRKSYIDPRDEY